MQLSLQGTDAEMAEVAWFPAALLDEGKVVEALDAALRALPSGRWETTVLRDGDVVASRPTSELDLDGLASLMVGGDVAVVSTRVNSIW